MRRAVHLQWRHLVCYQFYKRGEGVLFQDMDSCSYGETALLLWLNHRGEKTGHLRWVTELGLDQLRRRCFGSDSDIPVHNTRRLDNHHVQSFGELKLISFYHIVYCDILFMFILDSQLDHCCTVGEVTAKWTGRQDRRSGRWTRLLRGRRGRGWRGEKPRPKRRVAAIHLAQHLHLFENQLLLMWVARQDGNQPRVRWIAWNRSYGRTLGQLHLTLNL